MEKIKWFYINMEPDIIYKIWHETFYTQHALVFIEKLKPKSSSLVSQVAVAQPHIFINMF